MPVKVKSSGGSKGGAPGARPPPTDQNFLNFMQFFGKSDKFVCWCPLLEGWRPLLREILDPPLQSESESESEYLYKFCVMKLPKLTIQVVYYKSWRGDLLQNLLAIVKFPIIHKVGNNADIGIRGLLCENQ